MGKHSNQVAGYRFKLRNHAGLTYGPIDAYLEFRGGDRTAWAGRQTVSGTLAVNAPKLFGGDKDQGGIVGSLYVMMGEPDQAPNAMLVSAFGDQTGAWRGFATVAFDGLYGSNNPYPQPQSHKIEKVLKGWDGDVAWYPEKAAIPISDGDPGSDSISFDYDGGASFPNIIELDIGPEAATIHLDYASGPNPDKFEVWFDDVKVIDTGYHGRGAGIFSGSTTYQAALNSYLTAHSLPTETIHEIPGSDVDANVQWDSIVNRETASFVKATATTTAIVKVYSPLAGTIWRARVWRDAINSTAGSNAINPAHALYYLRTQSHKGGEPTANIDEPSFTAAADRLYAEGFGICVRCDPDQESVEDIENRIGKLIMGSVNRSPVDGKLHLDLARGDYVLDDLPVVSDDDILDFSESPTTPEGAVNSVSVRYFDPLRKETIITPSVDALGLIDEFGLNHQVIDYPEIPVASLAARVATRELLQFITPSRAFDLVCKPSIYALQPNQYFRLQTPKRGIDDMVCIVGDKQGGTLKSGAIRLQAAQIADTMPDFASIGIETGVDSNPPTTPTPIAQQVAFEAPYINVCTQFSATDLAALPQEAGFLIAAAEDPANSRDFTLMVNAGAGYVEQGDGDWCPTLVINEAAALEDPLPVDFTFSGGKRLGEVVVGDIALWGTELCRVDALDVGAGTLSLGRACADTVPQPHSAGDKLWIYAEGSAHDSTEYTDGETVSAKLLTNTFSKQLPIGSTASIDVTFAMRQVRPYPPGALRIGGVGYPATAASGFDVTWTHRDRTLQADQLVDTEAASIGPEAGTRYTLRFKRADTSAVLVQATDIGGDSAHASIAYAGSVIMELLAVNDVGESWQKHSHTFTCAGGGDNTITGYTPYDPSDSETVIDGGVVTAPPPTSPTGPAPAIGGTGVASVIPARTHGTTVVDPVTYGASPSASAATNSTAFNAAYAALPGPGVNQGGIVRPSIAGTYQINPLNPIKPLSNTQLDLATNGVMLQEVNTTTDHKYGVWIEGKTNVEVIGGGTIGYRDTWSAIGGTTSEWGHCFFISDGSSAISIKNCSISKAVGDAISIGYTCSDVKVDQCFLTNCRRQGISNGGDTCRFTNTEISYINGTSPQAGIDLEPDYPATATGNVVDNCYIHHCAGPAIQMYKRGNNSTVTNCVLEYCNRGVYSIDSTGGIVQGNTIRYNHNSGIYLKGASTGWTIGGTGHTNAFYGNKTGTYGTPAAGGTTTSVTGQSTVTAKHLTLDATASATVGANTYGPI